MNVIMCCNLCPPKVHAAGSVINTAVFLSRLELKVFEKICLKLREDLQTLPIEVTASSLDVADEDYFFFIQADIKGETEEKILERNEKSRQNEMGSK